MNTPLHTAGILQTKAYRVLQGRVSQCLNAHGLNHGQWVMLGVVAEATSGIRLNTTADILGVKAPLITAMANELIAHGYVDRVIQERDRRAKLLIISPRGQKLLQDIRQDMTDVLHQLLDGVTTEELAIYQKVLAAIVANGEQSRSQSE